MSRKKRTYDDDDGRTIADMNVEGMPWYMPKSPDSNTGNTEMSKDELRAYKWAAVKAGLLVALVFGVVFFLFIAFCDFVWFK